MTRREEINGRLNDMAVEKRDLMRELARLKPEEVTPIFNPPVIRAQSREVPDEPKKVNPKDRNNVGAYVRSGKGKKKK